MQTRLAVLTIVTLMVAGILAGCGSGSSDPASSGLNLQDYSDTDSVLSQPRQLWGIWEIEIVPDGNGSGDAYIREIRGTQAHMNVVGIMESGSGPAVGIDPPLVLENGVLDIDIRLTHPFAGLDKFTGFDVRGILIGHGSLAGFADSLIYGGATDIELTNADGHTTLWNPTDYAGSGYVDGKMGKPDAIANYTATLNGYKYFADDLTLNMDVADMLKVNRGAFTAGSSNARHYTIRLGDQGLVFQYAVDANWWAPTEPIEVPDSFDVEYANCPEPYYIYADVSAGIWGGGGDANFSVYVYDWQKDVDEITLEAPLLMDDPVVLTEFTDDGDYITFSGLISNENLPAGDYADLLFSATGTDPVTSKEYTCYRMYHYPLTRIPDWNVTIWLQDDMAYKTFGQQYIYSGTDYNYGGGDPSPVSYTDTDGPWDFTQIPDVEGGAREALPTTDPEVAGFAGEFGAGTQHFFRTQMSLSGDPSTVYMAESHSEPTNLLRLKGVYLEGMELPDDMDPAIPLNPPIDMIYPLDTSSHFTASESYDIIPFLLTLEVEFERWGLGEGVSFIPFEPGVNGWGWEAQACLLTRTHASFGTGGMLGEGLLGSGVMYEWIADDGTLWGVTMAGNASDGDPNYDDTTYEITGFANCQTLRDIEYTD